MHDIIKAEISEAIMLKSKMLNNIELIKKIEEAVLIIVTAYKNGKKVMIAGNGGSAADAQHMAGEFVSKFYFDRPGLPAIALTTDTSILTAIGNDYGYEQLFSRQIQASGVPGDVFIGISTSGSSPNILRAIQECKKMKITSIGFTGQNGDKMIAPCDLCIQLPCSETPRIQEAHTLISHIICGLVESVIFRKA